MIVQTEGLPDKRPQPADLRHARRYLRLRVTSNLRSHGWYAKRGEKVGMAQFRAETRELIYILRLLEGTTARKHRGRSKR